MAGKTRVAAGPVSAHLKAELERRSRESRVLVWYDAEGDFGSFFDAVELDGTGKCRHGESFFRTRRDLAEFLPSPGSGGDGVGAVVLYVGRARLEDERNVLLPVECLGEVYEPSLSSVAHAALDGALSRSQVDDWLQLPDMSLHKLDELAGAASDIAPLDAVFGKETPQGVGLLLLSEPARAEAVVEQGLLSQLRDLLERTFDVRPPGEVKDPEKLRSWFAQRVLLTEFIDDLEETPEGLADVRVPDREAPRRACREVARQLRDSRALEESYRRWAGEAQSAFDLEAYELPAEVLGSRDTFEFEERLALRHACALAADGRWAEARRWIGRRSESFWVTTDEQRTAEWLAARWAVELRLRSEPLLEALPRSDTPEGWVARYVEGEGGEGGGEVSPGDASPGEASPAGASPGDAGTAGGGAASGDAADGEAGFWQVDQLLRRLNSLPPEVFEEVEEIVTMTRERATELERRLAERFVESLREADGDSGDVPLQLRVFRDRVQPLLERGKVAFVLADALRYEMGRELADALDASGDVEPGHALATPPTITRVGMAALVPGAEDGMELTAGNGSVVPRVSGQALATVNDRMKRFVEAYGGRVRDVTLERCLRMKRKALASVVDEADLLIVRSQEIDAAGETDLLQHARSVMGQVIPDLQSAIHRLSRAGVREFVVTADHGYLLRDDISEAMKLDVPSGEVVESHGRCVVGCDLGAGDHHVVFRAADFGLAGDLQMAFPRGINVFRVRGGNRTYHHGGVSLQEMLVPVLRYSTEEAAETQARAHVDLETVTAKITSAFFQVKLTYQAGDLLAAGEKRRFRVVAVGEDDEVLGQAFQASHGYREAGSEVELGNGEESVVMLGLTRDLTGKGTLELRVIDVELGDPVATREVEFDLAF